MKGYSLCLKVVLCCVLFPGFLPVSAFALETAQNFYGLNQAEIKYYEDALRADPLWAQKASIFNGLNLDRLSWKDFVESRGWALPEYDLVSYHATEVQIDRFRTRITIPGDLKFVASDGHVVGDEVCAGETIRLAMGEDRGEFWVDGGSYDTPPVYWAYDVRGLAYDLVKAKVQKHRAGQATYPSTPLERVFSLSGLFDWYGTGSSPTILDSPEQQENLRSFLSKAGYVKEAGELAGAEYSAPEYDRMDPSTLKYILIKKGGSEIGRILLRSGMYGGGNASDPYGSYAVVSMGGRELASLILGYDFQVYVPGGAGMGPMIDPLAKVPVYRITTVGTIDAAVVCTRNGAMTVTGAQDLGNGNYVVTSKDSAGYSANYIVDCMYYFYGIESSNTYTLIQMPAVRIYNGRVVEMPDDIPAGYVPSGVDELFQVGALYAGKTWKVVSPANPKVDVSVSGAGNLALNQPNVLRVLVKNSGDVDVDLSDVKSNAAHKFVSCDAKTVSPGETKECLIEVTPQVGEGVSVSVNYGYRTCGKSMKAVASKEVLSSQVVKASSMSQVYALDVSGGCVNRYYVCNSALEQQWFSLGFKCSTKEANKYLVSSVERIDLGFGLPAMPEGSSVAGARLGLAASGASKAQDVSVYSVPSWSTVSCVPGGDICAKPSCEECRPVYDLSGQKLGTTNIPGPGKYYVDVTEVVKQAYQSKDGKVFLQLRGKEDYGADTGSCGSGTDWTRYDLNFRGKADAPYLEIVFSKQ